MNFIKEIKKKAKHILLFIYKLNKQIYDKFHIVEAAMPQGKELQVDLTLLHKKSPKYGDWLIHPCVRYIPNGGWSVLHIQTSTVIMRILCCFMETETLFRQNGILRQ